MAIRAMGKVTRMYPNQEGCYLEIDYQGDKPKDNSFFLPLSHPNYNSIYSLVVVAAVHNYNLTVRVVSDIIPSEFANIRYIVVEW